MNIHKKIICLVVFILLTISSTAPALAFTPKTGVLNNKSNIRSTAGYTKILSLLDKNTKITIVGETNDWYQIAINKNTKGWVAKWLVDIASSTTEITKQKTAKVLYASRVRKTPEIKNSNIIEVVFPETTVQITGDKNDWYSIKYGLNKNGWIFKELISVATTSEQAIATSSVNIESWATSTVVLDFITEDEINRYWQETVNALRKAKGLRELAISPELTKTATIWANYLGKIDNATHDRPGGETAQQWINNQGIFFTKRNSPDGWKNNYFSENIGVKLFVKPTKEAVKTAMSAVLKSYLDEGPTGVHYRTTYYPDWNSFGAGYHPIKNANGTYEIYFVFHYGSVVL